MENAASAPADNTELNPLGWWTGAALFGEALWYTDIRIDLHSLSQEDRESLLRTLKEMPYEAFLKTRYWYAIRLEVRRLRVVCETCKVQPDNYEIHHRSYRHHGQEHDHLEDLVLLCPTCHRIISEAVRSVLGRSE